MLCPEINLMNILHSTYSWLPQTQTWIYTQLTNLPNNVTSHVVCQKLENLHQFNIQNIHCYSNLPLLKRKFYNALKRFGYGQPFLVDQINKNRIDLLHSHFGNVGWQNIKECKRTKINHVVTFYGYDVNYLPVNFPEWRSRYLELFDSADRIICEGSHMAKCIERLGCDIKKIKVNHLGISVHNIHFKPRVWNHNETLKILMSASFTEKKGIPNALLALAEFSKREEFELTIIGDAVQTEASQKEKKRIIEIINMTNLKNRTRLLGYQPHAILMDEAYKNHIFISPSITTSAGDTEGGAPVTLVEMAATGMPIISTKHCDIPEVVENNVTGLLAEENDVSGLVSKLHWLVNNPDKWESIAEAGRRKIEQEFNSITQGQKLSDIYRSVLD